MFNRYIGVREMALSFHERLLGGWIPLQNKEKENEMLKIALVRANEATNCYYVQNIVKVLDAQQQLVDGMNYKLTFELGPTNCKLQSTNLDNINHCVPSNDKNIEICNVVIWQKVWLNQTTITHFDCVKK
ncbi:hypothetical protein B4U80_13999 [Leptotrombidium deliense]|uniref:Cystatin domain-containing protein n=1 Tax=Leptotrombidium deliense TaxID=299467 RepID=A0A443S5I3_9ACAR|nr:hypothetical protein B4U80_13999 [Leptotrombidium deliense]